MNIGKFIRSAYKVTLLLALGLMLFNPLVVMADPFSSADLKAILLQRPHYDPSGSTQCETSPASSSSTAAGGNVFEIGDSLSVGMRDSGGLEAKLVAAGNTVTQIEATVGISIPGSITKIDTDATNVKAADKIIVELGTNGARGATTAGISQDIQAMVQKIKSVNATASIYWINLHSTVFDVSAANAAISAEAIPLGYTVIDWNNEATSNSSKYSFDADLGVHQTSGQGYSNMSDFVSKSLGNSSASNSGSGSCCTSSFAPGSLPAEVPEPYNGIFTAAGNKINVSPAFIAAIFYGGEHGNSFPTPPPPYGSGAPWATSPANAQGPFQFIPSTWAKYGVDGNGDGKIDPQDLTDGAFAAAKYLGEGLGTIGTTDELKLRQAAANYNGVHDPNASYPTNVWNAFVKFGGAPASTSSGASSGGCTSGSGAYQNPFRDVPNLVKNRIDQGVDYDGSGPVYAIGNGTINGIFYNFYAGLPYIAYTLSDGPAQGKTIYFAECISIPPELERQVKAGGKVSVTSETVIANMDAAPSSSCHSGTEMGWADASRLPNALAHSVYTKNLDGHATAYGVNFSQLMVSLGSQGGIYEYPSDQGHELGALEPGWPTW